jgi:TetR/AcrR family transcriptional regulator, repressor for uid operon
MRKIDPEKHEKKRREILAAAEQCFVRSGFRGASISDICAAAKISPGHLYHYFSSKEAIIGAMTEARLEHAASRFSHMMKSSNAVTALLAELDRINIGYARRRSVLVFDMLAEAGRNPMVGNILKEHSRQLRALLAKFLREAQERGHVDRSLDADMTAAILMSVVDGARGLRIRDSKLDMTKGLSLLKTLVARFLTPTNDTAPPKPAGRPRVGAEISSSA